MTKMRRYKLNESEAHRLIGRWEVLDRNRASTGTDWALMLLAEGLLGRDPEKVAAAKVLLEDSRDPLAPTLSEALKALGVTRQTVYALVAEAKLDS